MEKLTIWKNLHDLLLNIIEMVFGSLVAVLSSSEFKLESKPSESSAVSQGLGGLGKPLRL